MKFIAKGHKNVLALHKTTFEITKEQDLTPKGDCIIGVSAEFKEDELMQLLLAKHLIITLEVGGYKEIVHAIPNTKFLPGKELVFRKSEFHSARTLAIHADKACCDFSRDFVKLLKSPDAILQISIEDPVEEEAKNKRDS